MVKVDGQREADKDDADRSGEEESFVEQIGRSFAKRGMLQDKIRSSTMKYDESDSILRDG